MFYILIRLLEYMNYKMKIMFNYRKKMAMHASNLVRTIRLEIAITSPGLMLDSTLGSVFTSPHAIPMIQVVITATPVCLN